MEGRNIDGMQTQQKLSQISVFPLTSKEPQSRIPARQ